MEVIAQVVVTTILVIEGIILVEDIEVLSVKGRMSWRFVDSNYVTHVFYYLNL